LLDSRGMRNSERRSVRVEASLPVRWLRAQNPVTVAATDLNVHGLFLITPTTIAVGYLMHLEVTLPSGPIRMMVVSRFCGHTNRGHGIGVEIFAIAKLEQRRWLEYYGQLLERRRTGVRSSKLQRSNVVW